MFHAVSAHFVRDRSGYLMPSAWQSSIASISSSRIRCLLYVIGQSVHTQLARGVHNLAPLRVVLVGLNIPWMEFSLRFVDCRISSWANVLLCSRQPLQSEQTLARCNACCCVLLSLPMAVQVTAIVSLLHFWQTTTFELPTDLHLLEQKAHVSDPK